MYEHDRESWKNPRSLVQLAQVPLLLQMLIISFEENKNRIPKNEGELIQKYVDIILKKREPGKRAGSFPPELKIELLGAIARKMFDSNHVWSIPKKAVYASFSSRLVELKSSGDAKQEYEALDIWNELKNNNLLIEEDDTVYFPHPLIQDLFVGLSIRASCFSESTWEPNITEIYKRFGGLRAKWFGDPDFDSGIMMLGIIPEEHQLQALSIFASINPTISYQAFQKLDPDYKSGLSERFVGELERYSLSEGLDKTQYENLVDAIGKFEPIFVYGTLKRIADNSPLTAGRKYAVQKIWNNHNKYGDDAISFLKRKAISDRSEEVRGVSLRVISRKEDIEHIQEIIDFIINTLETESQGFIEKYHPELAKVLNSAIAINTLSAHSLDVRITAEKRQKSIWLLGRTDYRKKTNELLCGLAQHEEIEIRREAARSLRFFASLYTVNTLKVLLNHSDEDLKIASISALKNCAKFDTLPALKIALVDPSDEIGNEAVDALYMIGDKKNVFTYLAEAAGSNDVTLRRRSIATLARIAEDATKKYSTEAARELTHHVKIKDTLALLDIAWGIRKVDLQQSNQMLYTLSTDHDNQIRELAKQKLEQLGLYDN